MAPNLDFAILEATDRVGGRMFGIPLGTNPETGQPYTVQVGANWVVGLEGNPAWELVLRYGLGGVVHNFGNLEIYDENGDFNLNETYYADGTNCGRSFVAFSGALQLGSWCLKPGFGEEFFNVTTQDFCEEILGPNFVFENNDDLDMVDSQLLINGFYPASEENPAIARVCEFYNIDWEHASDNWRVSNVNSYPQAPFTDFEAANYYVLDDRGYVLIVEQYAAEFLSTSVRTETEVKFNDPRLKQQSKIIKVVWDPTGVEQVEITYCLTEKVVEPDAPILYPCISGTETTIVADYFVSTLPMGVLKESVALEKQGMTNLRETKDIAPVFEPPLSSIPSIGTAIETAGFAAYSQFYFQFPFRFWPANVEILLSAHSQDGFVGDFAPVWVPLDVGNETSGFYTDSNVMFVSVVNERSRQLQELPDSEVISQFLPVLNNMFGEEIQALNEGNLLSSSDVLDFGSYRWSKDPLYRGMYRFADIEGRNEEELRKRHGNLVFSGEYSCNRHGGWTHGAMMAGIRSVQQLLQDKYDGPAAEMSLCDMPLEEVAPGRRLEAEERFLMNGLNYVPSFDLATEIPHIKGRPSFDQPLLTIEDLDERFRERGTNRGL